MVKERELYRKRSDYQEALGAFDWELPEDMHPDFFVGDTATWWLDAYPKTETSLSADRISRSPPSMIDSALHRALSKERFASHGSDSGGA